MQVNSQYGLFWGDTLYECGKETPYIIEHLLNQMECVCISAEEGVGKSILVQQMMFNLTTGEPFLDTFEVAGPQKVLFIQTEGSKQETNKRCHVMKKSVNVDDRNWVHCNAAGLELEHRIRMDELIKAVSVPGMAYNVIIIDSKYTSVEGDLNSNMVARMWVKQVRRLMGHFKAAMIIVDHDSKEQWASQSGQKIEKSKKNIYGAKHWGAFFTHNYKLREYGDKHILEIGKDRSGDKIDTITMKMIRPQIDATGRLFFTTDAEHINTAQAMLECHLKDVGSDRTPSIYEIPGISRSQFFELIKKFVKLGYAAKVKDEHGHMIYTWIKP